MNEISPSAGQPAIVTCRDNFCAGLNLSRRQGEKICQLSLSLQKNDYLLLISCNETEMEFLMAGESCSLSLI